MVKELKDLEKLNNICEKISEEFYIDMERMGSLLQQRLTTEIWKNFTDVEERNIAYRIGMEELKAEINISFLSGIAFPKK